VNKRGLGFWVAGATLCVASWAVVPAAGLGATKPLPSVLPHPTVQLSHPPGGLAPAARPSAGRPPVVNPVVKPVVKPAAKPAAKPLPAKPSSKSVPTNAPKLAKPAANSTPSSVSNKDERIHITSDYMKYDRKGKTAFCNGNVIIVQADQTISTAEVQFDQGAKISYMNKPVHVVQKKLDDPQTTLDSGRMTVFHKEKRLIAEGGSKMVRAKNPNAKPKGAGDKAKMEAAIKKEDTVITSDSLEYWTIRKDASFKKDVVMINGQKKAWGDTAFQDNSKNTFTLDGHVRVVQINGSWLVKEGLVKAESPDEARDEALRERSTLTSDHLVLDQATNDAIATGNIVRVEQKGKVATGKRAVFSDKEHTITMTENVRVQQANGDWLTAMKAVFHNDTEVFEAFSGGPTQVQTEFDVPNKDKPSNLPSPQPSGGRVQMEFDVNTPNK
jgi:lipopolysaccharide export system protein LptA